MKLKDLFNGGDGIYVVAEVGSSHDQSLTSAMLLIREAAAQGVDAVKFQYYRPEHMAFPGQSGLHQLYRDTALSPDWLLPLQETADEVGVEMFCSVFHPKAVDDLEKILHPPAYKIAYFESEWQDLYDACKATGKYVITSSYHVLDVPPNEILLYCVSDYPASPTTLDLWNLSVAARENPAGILGFSDHTTRCSPAAWAVCCGARVLEKHVRLPNGPITPDLAHSLPTTELGRYISVARQAYGAVRVSGKGERDREGWRYKRSLWTTREIKEGEEITKANTVFLRPNTGLTYFPHAGIARRPIPAQAPITENDLT